MKQLFPGFYAPAEADLVKLWSEGTVILDASALLKLYEVPEQTRQETFAALRKLGSRLWVPHQAALEYQRNRTRTIGIARTRVADALEPMKAALSEFMRSAAAIKLGERGYQPAADRLRDVGEAGEAVIEAARAAIANHVDPNGDDPIRRELDSLLDGRVGEAPTSAQIEEWNKEAQARYVHRMGPGHLDQDKKKNPTYMVGDLVFDKRNADLYLWKQTIAHASSAGVHGVIMVTNDRKPDWWKVTEHGVAGPLPELCEEIRHKADLSRFWMYDLESFLREAGHRLDVSVSKTTLSDMAMYVDEMNAELGQGVESALDIATIAQKALLRRINHLKPARTRAILQKTLADRGYKVIMDKSPVITGYRDDGEGKAVGIAVAEDQATTIEIVGMIGAEVATMHALTEPQRVQLFILAPGAIGTPNGMKLAYLIEDHLESHNASGAEIDIFYGVDDHFMLMAAIRP